MKQLKMSQILSFILSKQKIIFFVLTLLSGLWILSSFSDFQYYLAQGDHGQHLYSTKMAFDGHKPYRDFFWWYSPLMLYYYSFFYYFFGVTIQSILLGQNILLLLSGIFIYLASSVFISPVLSFMCALWYWTQRGMDFAYTFNHPGGVLLLTIILYCLFEYFKKPRNVYVWLGALNIFLLFFVRINMALGVLVLFFIFLSISNAFHQIPNSAKQNKFYFLLGTAVLAGSFLIYWYLLKGLPAYIIHQCFAYFKSDQVQHSYAIFPKLYDLLMMAKAFFNTNPIKRVLGGALVLSLVQIAFSITRKKVTEQETRTLLFPGICLFVLMMLCLHEFIMSGIVYRANWAISFEAMLIFLLLESLFRLRGPLLITPLIKVSIVWMVFGVLLLSAIDNYYLIESYKSPEHELIVGKNHIYTTQPLSWFKTVEQTTQFIKEHTKPSEKIFAIPYEPLYYFLAERDCATRQTAFFLFNNITEEQERKTIEDLEKEKVNWIILSNRIVSTEYGMGIFGQTHCKILWEYINKNFGVFTQFGEHLHESGDWATNHSTYILKRK
ncbi:MAG: hypothetical protein HQL24_00840 [Candidatus Omnitrophica bacterium]|nr:hypothetical protein [Candidatus Omnitrophota bacterium]